LNCHASVVYGGRMSVILLIAIGVLAGVSLTGFL
jgi:hypothetical protein